MATTQRFTQPIEAYRARQPVPLATVFVCVFVAAIVLRAFTFTTAGLDWDESLYVVIAQRWLHGGIPYVAVWDQHPMGLPALFAVAQSFIGDGLLAARIVALLAVSGTTVLLYVTLARQGERLAGALAASLYLLYMSRPDGLAANTEVINNVVVSAAALLLMHETATPSRQIRAGGMFLAALLLGLGLQIKYVVIPEAVFLCCLALALAWHAGASSGRIALLIGVAILGGILPTSAATLYFWQAGALQPYLSANIHTNIAYLDAPLTWHTSVMRLRYGLLPMIALLPWPVVLVHFVRRSPDQMTRRIALWLFVWLLAAAIDVVLPLKFWKHYFNALLPPLSLMTGLAIVLLARRLGHWRSTIVAAATVVVAIPALLLVAKHASVSRSIDRLNVPRAIADKIQQSGSGGRDVYVFNYDPLVYSYADAVPPTRYVLGIELANFDATSGARPLQEVDAVLRRRPEWIVVADPSPYAFSAAVLQRLHAALRDYELDGTWREADYIQPPIQVRLYHRIDQDAHRAALASPASSTRFPSDPCWYRAMATATTKPSNAPTTSDRAWPAGAPTRAYSNILRSISAMPVRVPTSTDLRIKTA